MNDEWWERPVCILCDYWWAILLVIILASTAYFTRSLWLPPAPLTPMPVQTATRVSELGSGDIQVTLLWNTVDDLDLWVTDPSGETIFFEHSQSVSGGQLDVDANPACEEPTTQPVENIFWPTGIAPHGTYLIQVNYYKQCVSSGPVAYTVRVLVDGQTSEYQGTISIAGNTQDVTTINR